MSALAEQVAALQHGDTVTATFQVRSADISSRTYTVTGAVHTVDGVGFCKAVGCDALDQAGVVSPYLVSINSVTPKPLDEPAYHGAMLCDRVGDVWVRNRGNCWVCIEHRGGEVTWGQLVAAWSPLTPFVPTPDEEAGR